MSVVKSLLLGDGALLALAVAAVFVATKSFSRAFVYGAALAISLGMLIGALAQLLGPIKGEGFLIFRV